MCMADYSDPTDFYTTSHPKARKQHRCGECARLIQPGEKYQRAFMVNDGYGMCCVTCLHCEVAMQWLGKNCGGWLHGAIWEDIKEHIGEYPTLAFSLMRLRVGEQRCWRRFDGGGLMPVPTVPPSLEEVGLERRA